MRLAALALAALLLAGCTTPPPGAPPPSTPPGVPATPRPAAGFNPLVRFGTDMGDFWVEVFEEMVPLNAASFLGYARSGFYEGIRVHRVVGPQLAPPDGFVIQLGDPNTRDPLKGRETWGQGDPNLRPVQDEYHPALRHDRAGVVSMAKAGPNSATSQFFVTLAARPDLDDRYTVVGRVAAGLDRVRAIGNVSVQGQVPVEDIVVRSTEVVAAQRAPAEVRHGVAARTYTPRINSTLNHTTAFGVVVENTGNVREAFNVTFDLPANWSAAVVWPSEVVVPAGMGQVVIAVVSTPLHAPLGEAPVTVRVRGNGTEAAAQVVVNASGLGRLAAGGSQVAVHYIGTMPDGRLFDSDRWDIVTNASVPKFVGSGQVPGQFTPRPQGSYTPLEFEVGGEGLIAGFNDGAFRLRERESRVVAVPPEKAYGVACDPRAPPQQCHPLTGRTLVFTLEMLRVG